MKRRLVAFPLAGCKLAIQVLIHALRPQKKGNGMFDKASRVRMGFAAACQGENARNLSQLNQITLAFGLSDKPQGARD
eukprot:g6389.t1